MDAKPTAKAQRWVEQCITANLCLCGCGKKPIKRGLAQNCYYAWRSNRSKLADAEKQAAYDARLIRSGRLLVPSAARAVKRNSVFTQVAAEVG